MPITAQADDDGLFEYADVPPPPSPPLPSTEIRIPHHTVLNEPERYRLPSRKQTPKTTTTRQNEEGSLHIRLRTRVLSASSILPDSRYPHIRRLHLHPSNLAHLIQRVTELLPAFIAVRIRTIFPEWVLPSDLILKIEKEKSKELFDTEIRAYRQLATLQGVVVPRCYGSVAYKGLRSLVLQDVAGVSLAEPAGLTLSLPELSTPLQGCHRELHGYNVHQGDPQLGNFRLVNGKLMAIDFEMADFDLSDYKKALFMKTNVLDLVDNYRSRRKSEWLDGSLEIDQTVD